MAKTYVRRRKQVHKTHRALKTRVRDSRRKTRRALKSRARNSRRHKIRKQSGGELNMSLINELIEHGDLEMVTEFLAGMRGEGEDARLVHVHNEFPRVKDDEYIVVIKDADTEDDDLQQKLIVIKMTKEGDDFKNVSMQFGDDLKPKMFLDEYQNKLSDTSPESVAILDALREVFEIQ